MWFRFYWVTDEITKMFMSGILRAKKNEIQVMCRCVISFQGANMRSLVHIDAPLILKSPSTHRRVPSDASL